MCAKQPRIRDSESVFGDLDGECRFDGRILLCFESEWLADLFQIDNDGFCRADWRQYQRTIFTKVKAAKREMCMLSGGACDRMENWYGAPRFRPEVLGHLDSDTERSRAFDPDFKWVDKELRGTGVMYA